MPNDPTIWAAPESMPAQTGSRRIPWTGLPQSVSAGVERVLGGVVAHAASQQGGFSEGVAARIELADGRRAFVKAVDTAAAPAVGRFHRREAAVAPALPPSAPVPQLLGSYDDGQWAALIYEDIDGNLPAQPWSETELERVLNALTDLAEHLTPAPRLDPPASAPRLGGWTRLADNPTALKRLTALAPQAAIELDLHQSLETRLEEATTGATLVHGDLYPFNLLLTANRVVAVDWPHAWTGPAHADLVMLLGSVALSGIDPEPYAARHPLLKEVEPEAVDVLISAQAGFLLAAACSTNTAADSSIVRMMTSLATASLRWLSTRRPGTR